jgi:hypothetical protein
VARAAFGKKEKVMIALRRLFIIALVAAFSTVLAGCKEDAADSGTGDEGTATSGDTGTAADEITEAMAQLPAEDRALAEKQKTCPVSDQALGSMGKPIKVAVGDRDVFICCEGCEEELKNNSEKYLAKLAN